MPISEGKTRSWSAHAAPSHSLCSNWRARCAANISYLRQSAHEAIRDQVRAYQAEKQTIENDNRLSGVAVLDDLMALRERITSAINDLETQDKQAVERVRAAISRATQEPQDVAAQTLRELQIQQGYQRIQLQMTGGDNLLTIATQAGKQGDKAVIQALRVYTPALLVSMDANAGMADAAERALALAETPFMGQTQLVCRDLSDELEVGSNNLTGAAAGMSRHTPTRAPDTRLYECLLPPAGNERRCHEADDQARDAKPDQPAAMGSARMKIPKPRTPQRTYTPRKNRRLNRMARNLPATRAEEDRQYDACLVMRAHACGEVT